MTNEQDDKPRIDNAAIDQQKQDLGVQDQQEQTDTPEDHPKSSIKSDNKKFNFKTITGHKLFWPIVSVFAFLLLLSTCSRNDTTVVEPTLTNVEIEARIKHDVAVRTDSILRQAALDKQNLLNSLSRNFDCNASQTFCHTQDSNQPYDVVTNLQKFQFLPDTPYEVYIEVYPLQIDQHKERKGSICSPNNIHLFLCQKVVVKNPGQMTNQLREMYSMLTPSVTYRIHISGRPIQSSDIDYSFITSEVYGTPEIAAQGTPVAQAAQGTPEQPASEATPCIPPNPATDRYFYDKVNSGQMTCEEFQAYKIKQAEQALERELLEKKAGQNQPTQP